jgi:hypothetical protein
VFGKISSLVEQLGITPADVLATKQLALRLSVGKRGRLRQWNGKLRVYYEAKDHRIMASSYTAFVDFVDEVYELLRAEGVSYHRVRLRPRLDLGRQRHPPTQALAKRPYHAA